MRPIVQQFLQQQLEPPHLVTMNENVHSVSVKAMIKEGFGLGWIPQRLARENLSYNSLALAGGPEWQIPIQIRLYRLRDNSHRHLNSFWELVQSELSSGSPVVA